MKSLRSYFNTNKAKGETLKAYEEKAKTQEQAILELVTEAGMEFTASGLQFYFKAWPITSIRRAICNLRDKGSIVETERQTPGPYGRPERVYLPKH